mmetsp:Transcript_21047/g.40879  ORF Transcript_21047/g.40879 Transcript_21047/m.40879 type:complete len:218 (-) Transcript_21047:37-690(-)
MRSRIVVISHKVRISLVKIRSIVLRRRPVKCRMKHHSSISVNHTQLVVELLLHLDMSHCLMLYITKSCRALSLNGGSLIPQLFSLVLNPTLSCNFRSHVICPLCLSLVDQSYPFFLEYVHIKLNIWVAFCVDARGYFPLLLFNFLVLLLLLLGPDILSLCCWPRSTRLLALLQQHLTEAIHLLMVPTFSPRRGKLAAPRRRRGPGRPGTRPHVPSVE